MTCPTRVARGCKAPQGAGGGSDEAIEAGELQEAGNGAEAAGVGLVKDQQQGQDARAKEVLASGAVEESLEGGVEVWARWLVEVVVEGGDRDAGLLRELALGQGRAVLVFEVGGEAGDVQAAVAEGLTRVAVGQAVLPGVDRERTVRLSHGSLSPVCLAMPP
jgi:hypothetical protein